jgi:hypothetical protein
MTIYKEFNFGGKNNPLGNFSPLIVLILFLLVGYFLISGLFKVLSIVAPFLLIGAAILDYTVITDYVKFILKLLKENPLFGLIAILLTLLGHNAVFGFLFFKALMRSNAKKFANKIKEQRETFADYEEVKENEKEDDFLELPNINKSKPVERSKDGQKYDDLFK